MANVYTDKLKLRLPTQGDLNWDNEILDNAKAMEFIWAANLNGNFIVSGLAPTDGGGLVIDYADGVVNVGGTQYSVAASNKTTTGSDAIDTGQPNYLYVDDSGVMQIATTVPTGDFVPIAIVDSAAADITRFADVRLFPSVLRLTETFEDADLDENDILAIGHNFDRTTPIMVVVLNNSNKETEVYEAERIDKDNLELDFSAVAPITGTYEYTLIG